MAVCIRCDVAVGGGQMSADLHHLGHLADDAHQEHMYLLDQVYGHHVGGSGSLTVPTVEDVERAHRRADAALTAWAVAVEKEA